MKFVEILAPGFEEVEALTPVDYLRRAGVEVILAGIAPEGQQFSRIINGARSIRVECDISFDEYLAGLNGQLPDGVLIPGGMPGAKYLGADKKVLDFIRTMNDENKLVCAICASPVVVLAQTGVLAGRKYTCYPGMNEEAASYVPDSSKLGELLKGSKHLPDASNVKDGNLITARGAGAAEEFAMTILEEACGTETMLKIKNATVQR